MLDHISWSQIDMFNRCPRQWAFRYIEEMRIPPSGALVEGSVYHQTLENNFRMKLETGKDLHVDECLDMFSDIWDKRVSDEEAIDWEDEQPGDIKDEGFELVETYMTQRAHLVMPKLVEHVAIRKVLGIEVVSVLDLVTNEEKIVDHKTSSRMWNQDQADSHGQATTYNFTLDKIVPVQFHVAVKPTKTLPARIQILETKRSMKEILWWVKMVEEILSQMQSGVYPPRPGGWYCSPKYCGFWGLCQEKCSVSIFTGGNNG